MEKIKGSSLKQFLLYFLRLGTLGFGGPVALANRMQADLVDERKWISHQDYKEGLAFAQLSPGPLAAQLAMFYLGVFLPAYLVVLVLAPYYLSRCINAFNPQKRRIIMKKLTSVAVLFSFLLVSGSSAMANSLVKKCKSDLKKFNCTAKTDAEAHECLEKNEKEGQPNEGYSKDCYEAHEAYEKKMGKEEKHEGHEHHD